MGRDVSMGNQYEVMILNPTYFLEFRCLRPLKHDAPMRFAILSRGGRF
jgi:hypothetical protein